MKRLGRPSDRFLMRFFNSENSHNFWPIFSILKIVVKKAKNTFLTLSNDNGVKTCEDKMNKRELSKLALKLYVEKSFWHFYFVKYIFCDMPLDRLMGFNLRDNESVKGDVPQLRELVKNADCYFVDLFSDKELLDLTTYLPDHELAKREARLEKYFEENLGSDLYNLINGLFDSDCNLNDLEGMPESLKRDIEKARYNSNLYET